MRRVDSLEKTDAGRDWGQEEKGMTEDEMAGWHHWLDGRESEWIPGVADGQGGLACCDSQGRKESDTTEQLNWTELNWYHPCITARMYTWWKQRPSVLVIAICMRGRRANLIIKFSFTFFSSMWLRLYWKALPHPPDFGLSSSSCLATPIFLFILLWYRLGRFTYLSKSANCISLKLLHVKGCQLLYEVFITPDKLNNLSFKSVFRFSPYAPKETLLKPIFYHNQNNILH